MPKAPRRSVLWLQVLRDIRGVDNVEEDLKNIKAACEPAQLVPKAYCLLREECVAEREPGHL